MDSINLDEINEKEKIKELIKRRRYQIITHSYIFYRLNRSIISNDTFDKWAIELIQLQQKYPEISYEVKDLYDEFCDFTEIGCAALLPLDNNERLKSRAIYLFNLYCEKQK